MAQLRVVHAEPLSEDVVETLEGMLERAKEGKISSVAIAAVHRDGSIGSAYSSAPSLGLLLGSVTRLQHRILGRFE